MKSFDYYRKTAGMQFANRLVRIILDRLDTNKKMYPDEWAL